MNDATEARSNAIVIDGSATAPAFALGMEEFLRHEAVAMFDMDDESRAWAYRQACSLYEGFLRLGSIDDAGAAPMFTPLETECALREDVACKLVSRDELLACAPESSDGYFVAPRTFD